MGYVYYSASEQARDSRHCYMMVEDAQAVSVAPAPQVQAEELAGALVQSSALLWMSDQDL